MYLPLYFEPKIDLDRLRTMLDTCGPWARRNAVRTLDGRQMAALFEACDGAEALTLDDIVPVTDPLKQVIHSGKNSLAAFNRFEKRFCRADGEGNESVLWGYNHQTMSGFTGPGYFVASVDDKGQVAIDYGKLPPRKPAGWPEIISNSARLGFIVWGGMTDYLRKVTSHVTIGRAWRNGKPSNDYFALCREDPPAV